MNITPNPYDPRTYTLLDSTSDAQKQADVEFGRKIGVTLHWTLIKPFVVLIFFIRYLPQILTSVLVIGLIFTVPATLWFLLQLIIQTGTS